MRASQSVLAILFLFLEVLSEPNVDKRHGLDDADRSVDNNNDRANKGEGDTNSNRELAVDGTRGLCVVGCTPYVDFSDPSAGILKYEALVNEMAKRCDIIAHIGDTKPGTMPCNRTLMTKSVHMIREAATRKGRIALYSPGDNELNDCHRHKSTGIIIPSDILKASDARQWLIEDLKLTGSKDLTQKFPVVTHSMSGTIPGTNEPYSCDFDKYVELDHYAVATMEVIGSHWYLGQDPEEDYPDQNEVDSLVDRLPLYLNAKECAIDWIKESAKRASANKKRAIFFLFHGSFYKDDGEAALGNNGIGEFYGGDNLKSLTEDLLGEGEGIENPYEPLFDQLNATAKAHPDLMIYAVHSDRHKTYTVRMNPKVDNRGRDRIESNHNLMIHQVEGDSRALTMYSRFTVHPTKFQPVTLKEEWSRKAFKTEPYGHSGKFYRDPKKQ